MYCENKNIGNIVNNMFCNLFLLILTASGVNSRALCLFDKTSSVFGKKTKYKTSD